MGITGTAGAIAGMGIGGAMEIEIAVPAWGPPESILFRLCSVNRPFLGAAQAAERPEGPPGVARRLWGR